MEIYRITAPDAEQIEALERLLPQLSPSLALSSAERWARIAAAPNTALFVAGTDGTPVVGMLSLAWYDVPSGRKAWIEDVVVDAAHRGRGIGRALLDVAITEAERLGASCVQLTSNPARTVARLLYRKRGFIEYDTTLFRLRREER